MAQEAANPESDTHMNDNLSFTEHYLPRGQGRLYARVYDGIGPTFVLMHGLPDNLHIYDDLIPYLTAGGRRVAAFDFLGFGASDKPASAAYDYQQQLGDLETVVETLCPGKIVPVGHDSSGFAAMNFTIEHPDRVASLCMLNSAYADAPTVHWPEFVEIFATPSLNAFTGALLQSPAQFGWLLTWQQQQFQNALPESQKAHFGSFIGSLIADNFITQPGAGPAFAQMTAQFYPEIARNIQRLPDMEALDIPVKLLWGEFDPYLTVRMAEERRSHLKHSSLHVLPAGHWLQADMPEQVAKLMLS